MCHRVQGKVEFLRHLCTKCVSMNGLLCALTNHRYAMFTNGLRIPSPPFADITLLALHPSFLKTFMSISYKYGIKWRYEFNHSKCGIVTFGESKPQHFESMKNCVWLLGDTIVDELYKYKNLGMLKNYVGSFSSNVEDNIDKTCKKVGVIFASNFDHCKVNPLTFVKIWKQACLPSLLFGVELWTLTPTLLLKLQGCQYWFLKHIFYVPEFAPGPFLLKLSGLNSIESEVATKKLLFSGRLITEPKMMPLIKNLFDSRTKRFFNSDISSLGVLPSIAESLEKFDLFYYFETWYNNSIFCTYPNWKNIVRDSIIHFEKSAWHSYRDTHPDMQIASSCLSFLVSSQPFLRHGGIRWLCDSDGAFCFVCKQDFESMTHFLLDCSYFKQNFLSLWRNLKIKITVSNQRDGVNICQFIDN